MEGVRRQRKFSSTHDIKIKRDFVAKSIVVCLKGSQRQFKVCKLSLLGKKLSSDSVVIVKLSRFGATGFPVTAEEGGAAGVHPLHPIPSILTPYCPRLHILSRKYVRPHNCY